MDLGVHDCEAELSVDEVLWPGLGEIEYESAHTVVFIYCVDHHFLLGATQPSHPRNRHIIALAIIGDDSDILSIIFELHVCNTEHHIHLVVRKAQHHEKTQSRARHQVHAMWLHHCIVVGPVKAAEHNVVNRSHARLNQRLVAEVKNWHREGSGRGQRVSRPE